MLELSIVVVGHNIENFIEQALRSCFFRDAHHYEIIAVDNGSTDRTLDVMARVAEMSPVPFRIIRNSKNLGPGEARNQGLAAANGNYLLFLDGDDWYREEVYHRLMTIARAREFDVIEFNHARAWDTGKFTKNPNSDLLNERDASIPEIRAGIMNNFGVVWNKLFRTSFLREIGVRFAHGIYEDVSWNFTVKMKANSYYVIPDILVNYRQRSGSITRTKDGRHHDIITEYRTVLSLLRENASYKEWYGRQLYKYGRQQLLHVANSKERLTNESAARYLREAYHLLVEWRRSINFHDIDLRLAALGIKNYGAYRAAHILLTQKGKFNKAIYRPSRKYVLQKFKATEKFFTMKLYKHVYCKRAIDSKKVILESYWGKKADCNPLAIGMALHARGGHEIIYSLNRGAAVPENFPFKTVIKESRDFYREIATAKYVISNTNVADPVVKRTGMVHVQTWHGTPIKVMGVDIRPFNPREMNWFRFAQRSKRWDYVISSNPHSTYAWRRACPFNYKVLEIGYPRNDVFFNYSDEDTSRIRKLIGVPEGKRVALYAPTVRDAQRGKKLLATDFFDAKRVADALGSGWVLIVRSHYFLNGVSILPENVIDASNYPLSNEVALISDLMITDYSSMMFDYACLKRPIIIYAYDSKDYMATRGVYFDIRENAPGAVTSTQEELIECLESQTYASLENSLKLTKFNAIYCCFDDGMATERFLQIVLGVPAKDDLAGALQSLEGNRQNSTHPSMPRFRDETVGASVTSHG